MFRVVKGAVKTVFCTLLLICGCAFAQPQGIDEEAIDWLLLQITLGEAKQDALLISDSLDRLLQIAPEHVLTRAAHARVLLDRNELTQAMTILRLLERDFAKHQQTKLLRLIIELKQAGATRSQYEQAKLAARAGNIERAIKGYQAVFSIGFPSPFYEFEYYVLLGRDETRIGQAKVGLTRLIERYPGVIDFEIQKARLILRESPEDKTALETLKQYANLARYRGEIESLWLNTLLALPLERKTLAQYQVFFKSFPNSSQGQLQFEKYQTDYAAYRKLLADPGYQAYLAGVAALDKEETESGYRYLTIAIARRPNDPNVIGEMGRALLQQGKHFEAKSYFEKAAKKAQFEEIVRWQSLAKTADFWGLISLVREQLANNEMEQAKSSLAKATALEEDPDTVLFYQAEILLAEGNDLNAFRLYNQLIRNNPNNEAALRSIVRFVQTENSLAALDKLSSALTQSQNQLVEEELIIARKDIAKALAQTKADKGEYHEALQLLASTPVGNTLDPWFYYQQAQIWRQAGSVKQGIRIFNEITWQYPMQSELRYAQALFLSSIDESEQALNALQFVPIKDKTPSIQVLEEELSNEKTLLAIDSAISAQDTTKAEKMLSELDAQMVSASSLKARIASAWYAIGKQEKGIDLLSQVLTQDETLAPYWHLQLGQWLLAAKDKARLKTWYERSTSMVVSTQEEVETLKQVTLDYQLLVSDSPRATLERLLKNEPSNMDVYARLVSLDLDDMAFEEAQQRLLQAHRYGELSASAENQLLEKALNAKHTPLIEYLSSHLVRRIGLNDSAQQQQLMDSLFLFRDGQRALDLAQDIVLLSSYDNELMKQAGDLAEQWGEHKLAAQYYERVVRSQPEQGGEDVWYVRSARRSGIARMHQKTDGHIAIAADFSGQTSTQSDAKLGLGASLFETYFPLFGGHGFVKLDNVYVQAQSTDFTASFDAGRYGTGYLCFPQCLLTSITPADQGIAFGFGWQNEQWRVDLGSTPQGFLLNNWVGGLLYQSSYGDIGYDIELKRRALSNSLLSFAGLEDVSLDKSWGGVLQQGITLGAYYDLGLDYGFWSTLDYHQFIGKNVKDNDRLRAMAGAYYRLYQSQNIELSVGSNLMYWGYAHNLSQETYGHGGYYSPQSYYGISLPVTLDGKWRDKIVYRVKLGAGYSLSETETIDFFPNNPEMQLEALLYVEDRSEEPVYLGSKDKGVSYSIQGMAEYHFENHWIIGLSLSVDRAELYEPNYAQLYLKYMFNPILRPLSFGPKPIVPYINF
ncbi:hypothetical protein PALB_20140 [Pseudoalteromonas luteoviolacea B = ATCC 29581]|nr:hypothetical protein PALB_20140 [Pseudoalteromonas luteoviolacea B = ATCC 29581]